MNVKKIVNIPLICGQPTDKTHPHIIKKGEVSIEKKELYQFC